MIKPRLFFLTMSLVAVLLAVSCAPAETAPPAPPLVEAESIPDTAAPTGDSAPEATAVPPTQIVDIQAVPTSLGPNLHATDPTTVSLASGRLQLVEFFRFT
jgi:hypothetical protein